MKKTLLAISVLLTLLLSSCFKDYDQEYFQYTKQTVEFDAAVAGTKVAGKYYPLLESITELNGVQKYRINFFGVQSTKDETINFRVDLQETTAEVGRDFRFVGANNHVIVPANSSYGYVEIEVLPTIVGEKVLVLELIGNDHVSVLTSCRGIAIPMTAFGAKIDDSKKVDHAEFLHVTEAQLGSHVSTSRPQFLDMRNALTYFWAGAQTVDASTINFTYMHSGSTSTNQANLVPPGFSTMSSTWGSAIYNRFLNWKGTKLTSLFYKVSAPSTALLNQYANISSKSDIQALYTTISNTTGRTTGERIVRVTSGDLIAYYCPELDYYAVIKVINGYTWTDFAAMSITSDTGFFMDIEYKVQK